MRKRIYSMYWDSGTHTLKLKDDKDMFSNITTIALKDCDVELVNQTKSDFANAQIVIRRFVLMGSITP